VAKPKKSEEDAEAASLGAFWQRENAEQRAYEASRRKPSALDRFRLWATKRGANQTTRESQKTKTATGSEKKESKPADYTNPLAWIQAVTFTGIIIFLLATGPLISAAAEGMMGLANLINPNNTVSDTAGLVWAIAGLLLLGFLLFTLRYNTAGLSLGIFIIFILVMVNYAVPMAAGWEGSAYAWCQLTNMGNLASCSTAANAVPPATKVGPTGMANVYFDTSSYGMTVFGDDNNLMLNIYAMPIKVINPSDTKIVKNFYIVPRDLNHYTGLYNSSMTMKERDKKLLGQLTPDKCTPPGTLPGPCTLQPGEEVRINLNGNEVVTDSVSDGAEVRLIYSYDYNGEGQNDFIFAANQTDYKDAKANSEGATKFEGPVDVTLVFSPDSIVTNCKAGTPCTGNVYMQLYLSKEEDVNHAEITSPISVTMLYPGSNPFSATAGTKTCASSWADAVTVSSKDTSETSSEIDLMTCNSADNSICAESLSVKQLLSCKYPYSISSAYVNHWKIVKFTARLNYTYVATLVKKGIFIQRIMLVATTTTLAD